MDAADSHIDSVLFQSFVSFETIQVFLQVILDFSVLQIVEIPVSSIASWAISSIYVFLT